MKTLALVALLAVGLAPAFGAAKDPESKSGPAYDPATVTTVMAVVTEVHLVAKGEALEGVNLTLKIKNETLAVYVAPADFVRAFGVTFKKGDVIEATGSKVNFAGAEILLAREILLDRVTLVLRDKNGAPYWTNFVIPTGL